MQLLYINCVNQETKHLTMKEKSVKYRTDFLLPKNSFISGMGSVLNLKGEYFKYNTSRSGLEADNRATKSDWGVVGQDIRNAFNKKRENFNNKREACL